MTRLDDMTIPYRDPSRLDGSMDELFFQLESEILGTLCFLRNGSESAALAAFDSLRARCEKYAQSGEVDNFRALVFRIIYNEANAQRKNDWIKFKRRRSNVGSSIETSPDLGDDEEEKKTRQVRDVLLQASFDDRAVFLLRQNGELTYEQIAKTLGELIETIKARMSRTLTAIAKVLAPTETDADAPLYLLLYGLLDENVAEETRNSVAADGAVAKHYDEALANREIIKRAAKRDDLVMGRRDAATRNVPVEPTLFEPANSVFINAEAANSNGVESSLEIDDFPEEVERAVNLVVSGVDDAEVGAQSKKTRKRSKKNPNAQPLVANELRQTGRANLFQREKRALFSRWQKAARYAAQTSGLTRVVVALLLLFALTASSALFLQSRQLRRLLRDEFRVQAALPNALVRGEFQQIVVCTSDINGKPKRTPVRFCFSDPKTRDFIIAHTESGNVDGFASYDLPELTNFPDEVCLSVFAGSEEVEAFQTFLHVKGAPVKKRSGLSRGETSNELPPDASPLWTNVFDVLASRFAHSGSESETVGEAAATDQLSDFAANVSEEPTPEAMNGDDEGDVANPFTLYMFPEIGRFAANYTNKTCVLCLDSKGRPQEGLRFFLKENESENPLTFVTDSFGAALLEWNVKKGASYQIGQVCDAAEETTNGLEETSGNEESSTVASEVLAQPDVVATDSYLSICFDPKRFRISANFVPPSLEQAATFTVNKRVLDFDDLLTFSVKSDEKTSLVMVLEKSGVIVGERLLASRDVQKQFEFKLPDGLVGLFKVSFYSYASPFRFEKIGETSVFRRYSADSTSFAATLETEAVSSASEESSVEQKTLVVKTSNPNLEKTRSKQRKWNELPMTLDVLWTPDISSALASLELDEIYGSLDEKTLEDVLATTRAANDFNPPILIDNLATLKTRVRDKLERYQSNEASASLWIVRLGFWGCAIIAAIAIYLNVFGVFAPLKGVGVIICAALCASFLWGGQKSLSQSFEATTDIVNLIDEDQSGEIASETKRVSPASSPTREKSAPEIESKTPSKETSAARKIALGTWKSSLNDLFNTDRTPSSGVILIKLNDGRSRSWTALPLENENEEPPLPPTESNEVSLIDPNAS